ncbi:MAG: hypothetical protein H6754_08720 [Candidatus Omnitrophica bacterium]|nr:hypothetical protein [Candidatus Omnitrophota bacterium]
MKSDESSMSKEFKRLLFVNVNKYQQQVLIPSLILCLLACAGVIYTLYYISYINQSVAAICHIDTSTLTYDVPWFMQMHSFNKVVPWILFGMTTVLLIIICWMFYVSNRILGPSIRVLKELDEILTGQRKDPIGTRKGDEFFEEFLKRVNTLIKKIP